MATISTVDRLKLALKTVTDAALFIEQLLAAGGVDGFAAAETEQITAAFANLASIAIQAAHSAADSQITPESVMALMPVSTALVQSVE